MKKRNAILLSLVLLCSCEVVEIPDDISQFLYSCHLEETIEKTKTIRASNRNEIFDENGALMGADSYVLEIDRTKKESYSSLKIESYEGSRIAYDTEQLLYVTKNIIEIHYLTDASQYLITTSVKGYAKEGEEEKEKQVSSVKYTESQFKEIDLEIFYTSDIEGVHTGGLYYADFFLQNIGDFEHYKVENDLFIFTLISHNFYYQ